MRARYEVDEMITETEELISHCDDGDIQLEELYNTLDGLYFELEMNHGVTHEPVFS